jgi:quercetin dioxygenase-like cupin family protein
MKTAKNSFFLTDEISWEQVGKGVQRKIMGYNEQIMTVVVQFEKGAEGTAHQHPHTQSTWVASGSFEFHVDGCTQIVKQGDGILIAPNLIHGCTCLEAGTLIDTFTPMRKDFL